MSAAFIPMRELQFVAKTGFISKDLWREFFTERSESRNSRVWKRYVQEGFFRPHGSKMLPEVLILGKRGEAELKKRGISGVTRPHLGLFDHDEKAALIMLKLLKTGFVDEYTTEAELKRKYFQWKRSAQDTRNAKFPDLTIELKSPVRFRTVALEIEQSLKSFDRYKKIMQSYSSAKEIDIVVFISGSQQIFNRIARAMKEVNFPSWDRPVGFGEIDAWLKSPLTAPIFMSREVTSIEKWRLNESKKAA